MGDWYGVGSSAVGVLGGIASSILSNNAVNKQIKAQQAENEKNRLYNAEQARLARQYNTQMVAQQRAYDSPSALMARLKEAGIHPALAYSNGMPPQDFGIGSTSAQANSVGAVGTGLPDFSGIGNLGNTLANSLTSSAEADYKNTLSRYTEEQIKYYGDIAKGQIQLMGSETLVNLAKKDWTLEDKDRIVQYSKNLAQEEKNLKATYDNLIKDGTLKDLEAVKQRLDIEFQKESMPLQLEKLRKDLEEADSRIKLNNAQTKEILTLLGLRAALLSAQANGQRWNNQILSRQLGIVQNELDKSNELKWLSIELERYCMRNNLDVESKPAIGFINWLGRITGALSPIKLPSQ